MKFLLNNDIFWMMEITVIGAGYVGLVTGLCLAKFGHKVWFLENNSERVFSLKNGRLPLVEPGLNLLFKKATKNKRIFFSHSYRSAINKTDIWFICVGTPSFTDGNWDLKYVFGAIKSILRSKKTDKKGILVIKSTINPAAVTRLKKLVAQDKNVAFAIMPEFLREGNAIKDFFHPDRVVFGIEDENSLEILDRLYKDIKGKRIVCSPIEASLIKVLSNAYLPMKISFANLAACYCEKLGADVTRVMTGVGLDPRIGSNYLGAGLGFGGSCFPKDIMGIITSMKKSKISPKLFESVLEINNRMPKIIVEKIRKHFKNKLSKKTIVVWGLTFKPNTDDIRESQAIRLLDILNSSKIGQLRAYDPVAVKIVKNTYPKIKYYQDLYSSVREADAIILATEWEIFKEADFRRLAKLMREKVIFDGRNVLDRIKLEKLGFKYYGIGR